MVITIMRIIVDGYSTILVGEVDSQLEHDEQGHRRDEKYIMSQG